MEESEKEILRNLKVIEVIDNNEKSKEEIEFEKWSNESYCLKAVEEDGYALQYVKIKSIFLRIIKRGKE